MPARPLRFEDLGPEQQERVRRGYIHIKPDGAMVTTYHGYPRGGSPWRRYYQDMHHSVVEIDGKLQIWSIVVSPEQAQKWQGRHYCAYGCCKEGR